ncbi:MAG TPA: hypothetical protein VFA44_15970 [Gaiellaceae bacterium]|nr:hypothetical protein [Gaiellaceae bacterium]
MNALDSEARRFQTGASILVALVTFGWMAGLGFGAGIASSASREFVQDTPAWLIPALQGVIALAISSVVLSLFAIVRRIRIRAGVLAETLPRLYPAATTQKET